MDGGSGSGSRLEIFGVVVTTWIGVDPGMDGAVAIYEKTKNQQLTIVDVPTLKAAKRRHVDAPLLYLGLDAVIGTGVVYMERAWSHPKQGVSSVFRYGHAFGLLHGYFLAKGLPLTFIAPQTWKRKLCVPADKALVRQRAGELMPWAAGQWPLKRHHNRAEAALIAYYGATQG